MQKDNPAEISNLETETSRRKSLKSYSCLRDEKSNDFDGMVKKIDNESS